VHTRAPSVPDRQAPPVGANQLALSPSLSLPRGPGLSAPSSSTHAHFSLCLTDPTCQLVPNLPPTIPRRGRAHDRVISGHLRMSPPLLSPASCSPTFLRSLAPSAEPSSPLSCSARATRELCHRPPSTVGHSATVVEPAPRLLPR
jgi:hypothetical protein